MKILGLLLLITLCGINVLGFILSDVGRGTCEDRVQCSSLQSDMCTNHLLQEYAAANCAKYCNLCPCEDLVQCSTLQSDMCSNPLLARYAAAYCPKYCKLCQSTVAPSTITPCIDADDRCSGLKDYCSLPYVAANCTLTCNMCWRLHNLQCKSLSYRSYVENRLRCDLFDLQVKNCVGP